MFVQTAVSARRRAAAAEQDDSDSESETTCPRPRLLHPRAKARKGVLQSRCMGGMELMGIGTHVYADRCLLYHELGPISSDCVGVEILRVRAEHLEQHPTARARRGVV